MIGTFGVPVLDERLHGPSEGGLHALIGGPGTGKTVFATHFLAEGVRAGGRSVLVTQARPEDVVELAAAIGLDLAEHLRSGRLAIIGYQPGFRERYRRSLEPREVFEELERLIGAGGLPDRIAIDTCGPLVESRETGNGAELLADMLAGLNSTVLLTFAAEHPAALENGFDYISQRAALILHVTLSSSGRRQFLIRKAVAPYQAGGAVGFDIETGRGIVPFEVGKRDHLGNGKGVQRRRVLILDVSRELPEELRLWFESSYDLFYTADPVEAFPELVQREFGLVVVNVDRRSVERGLHVMHQLRRAARRPPILVICPYDLRASDRAKAIRSGADDFISGGLNPDELSSRIQALLRRGRESDAEFEEPESRNGKEPHGSGERPANVREVVRGQLATPSAPIFSLVLLRPAKGVRIKQLVEHVSQHMRQGNGDRISVSGRRVEVFLNGAMANHAERFLERVRSEEWIKTGAVIYTFPTDKEELQKLVED